MIVDLPKDRWTMLLALLGNNVVWAQANPLLMEIGAQLQAQEHIDAASNPPNKVAGSGSLGDSQHLKPGH